MLTRHYQDLKLLVSRWSIKRHFEAARKKFTPTLEYVARLSKLPLYGDVNAVGIILEEDDQVKLKYLTLMQLERHTLLITKETFLRWPR